MTVTRQRRPVPRTRPCLPRTTHRARGPVHRQRSFIRDERAVSEAIGYILTFGISTVILVTSLHTFTVIQNYTEDVSRDRAIDEVAAQVGFAVDQALEAGNFAHTTENHFNMTLTVPRSLAGSGYTVALTQTRVYVNATQVETAASAGALGTASVPISNTTNTQVLCRGSSTTVSGGTCAILSNSGEITVTYGRASVNGGPDVWGVFFRPLAS